MADEMREPRRFKLPREYTDDDHAARRFGSSSRRPERDEYVEWRESRLRDEHDDLALRQRLLLEQAEVLRARASHQEMNARERLTADDHAVHLAATREAREKGADPPRLDDGGAAALVRQAADLEAEADEVADHLAQEIPA